eukprot:PITA_24767
MNPDPNNRQAQQEVEEDKEESESKAIPPFPERLSRTTQPTPEETELLGELKQLCVKIPLLQAIKYVPIYNKLIKEKFFSHLGKCKRDAPTINFIGQLSDLMLGQVICLKYLDPGSLVVDVHINGTMIPHTLIDLRATINVMTKDTMLKLNLQCSLRKTTIVLQLADRSTMTPEGIVEDVMVSIDSWEYPADFLVRLPKEKLTGYPLILGRPWLATADAYLSCRARNMTIKNRHMSKQLILYPLAQPLLEHDLPLWLEEEYEDEVYSTPLCALETIMWGKPQNEDDIIENLIQNPTPSIFPLEDLVRETQDNPLTDLCVTDSTSLHVKNIEFSPERTLKINSSLSTSQEKELCSLLRKHLDAFAWSYKEMKGVHPSACTHHIYIKEY